MVESLSAALRGTESYLSKNPIQQVQYPKCERCEREIRNFMDYPVVKFTRFQIVEIPKIVRLHSTFKEYPMKVRRRKGIFPFKIETECNNPEIPFEVKEYFRHRISSKPRNFDDEGNNFLFDKKIWSFQRTHDNVERYVSFEDTTSIVHEALTNDAISTGLECLERLVGKELSPK